MRIRSTAKQQLELELLSNHAIDLSNYVEGVITLGCDDGWQDALERQAERTISRLDGNGELSQAEYASRQRSIYRSTSRKRMATPDNNWNLYGVHLDRQGNVVDELEFFGQRLHPSNRPTATNSKTIKFDASGVRSMLYLPPITKEYAAELLSNYGFIEDEQDWSPGKIWQYIYSNTEIPIIVEESALKALASTSGGQLAIGLNGINSACQKKRTDLLRAGLVKLAKGGRRMTVRFDHGKPSEQEAQRLSRLLRRHGADAGWWCYLPHWHKKTDDYMAAIIRGEKDPLGRQDYGRVIGERVRQPYSRLERQWDGITIHREFEGSDIIKAFEKSRIVALRGATGTGKSKAILAAVEQLESQQDERLTILGLYCRASLVHKGAYEFGVRDLSAQLGSAEREYGFHEDRTMRDGLFCCPESIHKPTSHEETLWFWSYLLQKEPRNVVLILDEIAQTMVHLLLTGTDKMPLVRRDCIQSLERLITNRGVRVITAEASLGDLELQWLKDISGTPPYFIKSDWIRKKTVYVGHCNKKNIQFITALIGQRLKQGQPVWCGFGTKTTVDEVQTCFKDHYRTLVIHGDNSSSQEVSDFVSNTEAVGPLYELVIYSPAVSSGISMAATKVGMSGFVQQYAVPPEDALQALNRCRDASLRVLLIQKSAVQALVGTQQTTPKAVNQAYFAASASGEQIHYIQALQACSLPSLEYAIALEARVNQEALDNEHVLRSRLVEDGYEVLPLQLLMDEQDVAPSTRKQRGTSREQKLTLRQTLLRDLLLDQLTLKQASSRLHVATRNGLIVDLRNDDPAQAYEWLIRLRLKELCQLESFTVNTPEFKSVIDELKRLETKEVREVKKLFGRVSVPGPDSKIHAGPVLTLLQHAGFKAERLKKTSSRSPYTYSIRPVME
ncbi:MAG: DUF3854 domain-containing protein [Synechococcus sp.]|nr:DUF3854 domain-containing protein [Synechococcus sp.]